MENLDVLDEQGNKTGEIKSRDEIHEKGLWHRTVHIWVVNDNKDVLMQLRSPEKRVTQISGQHQHQDICQQEMKVRKEQ